MTDFPLPGTRPNTTTDEHYRDKPAKSPSGIHNSTSVQSSEVILDTFCRRVKNLAVLCFNVVSLLAHNTSVEIGISILHLNKCKRRNLVPSIRSMPKLNKHFCTVFIWIIFSLHCRGRASLIRGDLLPVSFLLPLKGVKGSCNV